MDFLFPALTSLKKIQTALHVLEKELKKHAVNVEHKEQTLSFFTKEHSIAFTLTGDNFNTLVSQHEPVISVDQLIREPQKIAGIVCSKLGLNKKIYARQCLVEKVDKKTAEQFLTTWHLMGATQSAYNLGLFYNQELVALASFSKGRKMNRLPEDKRSFELIRFCSISGVTITGGLTKLLNHFFIEKEAGDIMTYVDKQLSDGRSFINAGFTTHSETEPNYFLIDKHTFERTLLKDKDADFDVEKFYLTKNSGSIKLVYIPREKL